MMERPKVFLIVFMVCATAFNGVAQPLGSGHSASTVQEWVIAKNYYVSSLLSKERRLLSEVWKKWTIDARELGYVPYALGQRVSDVLLEFMPKTESLTIDWDEPLDP